MLTTLFPVFSRIHGRTSEAPLRHVAGPWLDFSSSFARIFAFSLLLAPLSAAIAADAPAAPPHLRAEIPEARLAGEGMFRWFGLRIYDARLWVGAAGFRPADPAAASFALELRYARALAGARIADASIDQMTRLGMGTPQQHAAWRTRMAQLFPDVEEGSRITGVNLPGRGARFYFDGKPLGDIGDPEFSRAFFAIWLSPSTSAPDLRAALLADAAARPAPRQ